MLCPWARHFTLTVPLSTQEYKWVPSNCWGVTCDGLASRPGEVEILLAASCYGNRDRLRPDEPVGSKGFTHRNREQTTCKETPFAFKKLPGFSLNISISLHFGKITGSLNYRLKRAAAISHTKKIMHTKK